LFQKKYNIIIFYRINVNIIIFIIRILQINFNNSFINYYFTIKCVILLISGVILLILIIMFLTIIVTYNKVSTSLNPFSNK
jgi:hypothetical protein